MKTLLACFLFISSLSQAGLIFDAVTGYKDRPEKPIEGTRKLFLANEDAFWPPAVPGTQKKRWPTYIDEPTQKRLSEHAKAWKAQGLDWVCFDIEHLDPQKDPRAFNAFMIRCAAIVRKAAPGLKLGFYGCPPIRDYYRSLKDPSQADFKAWQAENDAIRPAALAMDAIFPSLYTFYANRDDEWARYAESNLAEARRYGKPVYGFIWPRYHDSNLLLSWKRLDPNLWKRELDLVASKADGIVIWDYGQRQAWNESAVWWKIVKSKISAEVNK